MAKPKILLDSNIIIDGILSNWSASKALLIIIREVELFEGFVSALSVEEVENFLVRKNQEHVIEAYLNYIEAVRLKILPLPSPELVLSNKDKLLPHLKHIADLPIIVSAVENEMDWVISNNREHFSDQLAKKTGIKIASAKEFLQGIDIF